MKRSSHISWSIWRETLLCPSSFHIPQYYVIDFLIAFGSARNACGRSMARSLRHDVKSFPRRYVVWNAGNIIITSLSQRTAFQMFKHFWVNVERAIENTSTSAGLSRNNSVLCHFYPYMDASTLRSMRQLPQVRNTWAPRNISGSQGYPQNGRTTFKIQPTLTDKWHGFVTYFPRLLSLVYSNNAYRHNAPLYASRREI